MEVNEAIGAHCGRKAERWRHIKRMKELKLDSLPSITSCVCDVVIIVLGSFSSADFR